MPVGEAIRALHNDSFFDPYDPGRFTTDATTTVRDQVVAAQGGGGRSSGGLWWDTAFSGWVVPCWPSPPSGIIRSCPGVSPNSSVKSSGVSGLCLRAATVNRTIPSTSWPIFHPCPLSRVLYPSTGPIRTVLLP